MAGNVKLVYSISKKAVNLVKAGKAVVESGGVRGLDGRLIELAKPAVNSIGGHLTSPITMVSSLAGNVQSGFIQHGVNQANAKLDVSLEKLDQIQKAINGLSKTNALGWVNCAFGMVNCGVSLEGFYMTLRKLDEMSEQIKTLSNKLDQKAKNEYLELFDRYCLFINSDVGILREYKVSVIQTTSIPEHLDKIAAFLNRIIREFENEEIDGILGCNIIFNLSIAFAHEIKEYSAQYFYENGKFPANYEKWIQVLDNIDSESFKAYLKQFLIIDCLEIPTEEKYIAYSGAIYGVEYQLGYLEYTKQLVQQIEKKDYIRIDDFLAGRIKNSNFFEVEDKICIPIN